MLFSKPFSLIFIFVIFFIIFLSLAVKTMVSVPFYDFDEAHRAENAKRMKEYQSYFVPLTGSSFDRVETLRIPLKENPDFHLYYHLERPPLVYDLMILSTTLFGSFEFTFRLPSLILGMSTFLVFLFFVKKEGKINNIAVSTGLLALFTSSDLWLSSQFAQMDTAITLFLFLSLLTLIFFCSTKKASLIFLAGIFLGFSLLSKLQLTVIFVFPILCALILKKISFYDLLKFLAGALLIFLPWVGYLIYRFGITNVINIMPGFAISSASIIDIHHKAPFFWYIRWWWESFRPGWTLFLGLFLYDISKRNLTWQKLTLLSFIFGGLISFSIPINKLWWYVLPLIPAICYYVFISSRDYLAKDLEKLNNISVVMILASLPMFLQTSNTLSMLYGMLLTGISYLILKSETSIINQKVISNKKLFYIGVIISLTVFYLHFPKIIPYHINTKEVSLYYKELPGKKCLWTGDMPQEAVLFYSNAGEVNLLKEDSALFSGCSNNYLIAPNNFKEGKLLLRKGNIRLYQLTDNHHKLVE